MSVIRVTKKFKFEMGHALRNYDGLCRNIHGHSYDLAVTLKGKVRKDDKVSSDGMVIDFTIIKSIIKETIINTFDHALVLHKDMPIKKSNFDFMDRLIIVDFQPTCENLILHFISLIKPYLPSYVSLHHMLLKETATSFAEWYEEDN